MALPDEVEKFTFVANQRIAGTFEGQPDFAALAVDGVMHAGGLVGEIAGDDLFVGRAAGVRHGGSHVGCADRGVTFGAGFVADVAGGVLM
jgi:hypothetical protein